MSDEAPHYVRGHELIAAYMKLHPKWTTRGMGPDTFGCGVVWIETWESRVIARAQYHVADPSAVEAGDLLYAHTFVAVSVAEGFALLAGDPR